MLGGCVSKSELEYAIVKVLDFRLLMVLWMAREAACAIEDIRMGRAGAVVPPDDGPYDSGRNPNNFRKNFSRPAPAQQGQQAEAAERLLVRLEAAEKLGAGECFTGGDGRNDCICRAAEGDVEGHSVDRG